MQLPNFRDASERERAERRDAHDEHPAMPLARDAAPQHHGRCGAFLRSIVPPRIGPRAAELRQVVARGRPEGARRLWVLIPFANEVETLLLHLRTLVDVVDGGFIVSEATDVHTGDRRKPAVLRSMLDRGEVPSRLAHTRARARGWSPCCGRARQSR